MSSATRCGFRLPENSLEIRRLGPNATDEGKIEEAVRVLGEFLREKGEEPGEWEIIGKKESNGGPRGVFYIAGGKRKGT